MYHLFRRENSAIGINPESQAKSAAYLSLLETAHAQLVTPESKKEQRLTVLNSHRSVVRCTDDLDRIASYAKDHSNVTIYKRSDAFVRLQVPNLYTFKRLGQTI